MSYWCYERRSNYKARVYVIMKTIFYNPKYDTQSNEEKFLLRRRIRLMNHISKLKKDFKWYPEKLRELQRKLQETEMKLGIKT